MGNSQKRFNRVKCIPAKKFYYKRKLKTMDSGSMTLLMVPKETLDALIASQQAILREIKEITTKEPTGIAVKNITAKEFMEAVRIKRTKFDQLVAANKIKVIKKRRKIYLPITEIDRYFNDPTIL